MKHAIAANQTQTSKGQLLAIVDIETGKVEVQAPGALDGRKK